MKQTRLQRAKDRRLIRTPLRLMWKFRRAIFLSSLLVFIGWGINELAPHALSPMAKAELNTPVTHQDAPSEHEQIKAYIRQVFGDQASNAFKILACENHSLNPLATGINNDGSVDTGIFQINSFWGNPILFQDWKTNVNVAWVIYNRGGWKEWACESVWHALERNDTI